MAPLQLLTQLILLFLLVDSKNNLNQTDRADPLTTFEQRSILVMTIMIVSFNAWAVEGQFECFYENVLVTFHANNI